MEFMDFIGIKNKIVEQKQKGDVAACLSYEEVDGLLLLAKETWELRRTKAAAEADARNAGYREGQRDLQGSIAAVLGLARQS